MGLGRFLAVAAAIVLLVPAAAVAQSQINGSVTDDTGGVLPGVTVEASSPVLIEGSRLAVTDGTGGYNIIDLRPGEYSMTFTLPGFGTQVRDELILGADVQMLIDVALSVGSVEETITVSGETPVVDVQQVQRIEVMTRETQEAIPTGRSTWSYALLIPGVKVHKPDMGGTAGAQQSEMMGRGLDAAHTTIEIDGMMINTMISDGRYQAYLNPMISAETSYTTTGVTAETQSGGLRINMIPNEGGNQFSGSFFAGGTPSALQADNLNQRLQDLGVVSVPKIDVIYDLNGSMGGPLVRDKLWFFSTARRNVIDAGVTNSINRDGTPALDRNSITSANVRLTWQANSQNKISVMFDTVRTRRFSQHGFGTDLETASSSWTSPHYDTGTAKWTSTLSNRMLAEFGFSLAYEDWDPGYYIFGTTPIEQPRPGDSSLATCFSTPCFPAVGSPAALSQLSDPFYSTVHRNDSWLDFRYTAKNFQENNYSHRWAYQGALSYVTGSHSIKVGMNITNGQNRFSYSGNGDLQQNYREEPSITGRSLGFIDTNCNHYAAAANVGAGLPCGTIGTPDSVGVYNHPSFSEHILDYNGGVYAQDSWAIDRLTLNYGARIDFAAVSVPATPKPLGRFVNAFEYRAGANFDAAGNNIGPLPSFGPDFSPRFSMAYDLFGDARTALKFGFNKYVRDVGGNLPARYSVASRGTDTRDWFDCHLNPGGTACSGSDPYGGNSDDIAQNWEIGPGSDIFGFRSPGRFDVNNFARESNQIWTVGLQQEVMSGLSFSGEFRRRWYSNTWSTDNLNHGLSDFGALADGSPDPSAAGTGRYFDVLRPYPMVGSFTAFAIDPSVRTASDNVDGTMPVYTNVYKGFELSVQGRLPGGGTLFGGWTIEDTGRNTLYNYNKGAGSRYGGEVNNCADVLMRGDNPNELRFCDQGAYPRPFRNEFKLSGAQPFSLPGLGDLQVGASLQAYPGGAGDWGGLQEGFRASRTSTSATYGTYSDTFYGQPGHCVAPCVLGSRLVPDGIATIGTSTSSFWFPMTPLNSVKFLPYWTQLDANIQKVFNIGNWRYDARIEAFNMLNNAVEIWHTGSRNAAGSTGAGFQSLSAFERSDKLLEGRVIRLAVTARF
ncbi:MAG: TonB-dependent receptor [Acidobacteriota bacterium]|nr:TonB-dependent receptor [Acidobacteriota bacterium]